MHDEETRDNESDSATDLSHLIGGSREWNEFIDEYGYDPTDLSDFRDMPNSPAVAAYAGIPAAVYARPETYRGPNTTQVQAVLRDWRAQAQRLNTPPPLTRPASARPAMRVTQRATRPRSGPGRRQATARAPSASGGDDRPPSTSNGLIGRQQQDGARDDRGHFGVDPRGPRTSKEENAWLPLSGKH